MLKKIGNLAFSSSFKTVLVLGSGGIRGLAYLGVLEELIKADIKIDAIIGCSAGAIIGALYADNGSLNFKDDVLNYKFSTLFNYSSLSCNKGIFSLFGLDRFLRSRLVNKTFDNFKIPFLSLATNLDTGNMKLFSVGDVINAVCASCAIPGIFVPVKINNKSYVDGGVTNPIPTIFAKQLGAELIIAVDVSENISYYKSNSLIDIVYRSSILTNIALANHSIQYADIIIKPVFDTSIGMFSDKFNKIIYEHGRRATIAKLKDIKQIYSTL